MKINYNIDKLKDILMDFSTITGLSLAIADTDFREFASFSYKLPEFCNMIQMTKDGVEKCRCSDTELLERCKASGQFESHICHAGLTDAVMPIIKNSVTVGYIIIGRIRTIPEFSGIKERLFWLNTNSEELTEKYSQTTFFTEDQIKSLSHLLSFILFESAIEIEYDDFIKNAIKYIDDHIGEDISVDKLCRELYVSKNRLYDNFKKAFGRTVNKYISDKRTSLACKLLRETDKSINQIADSIGMEYTYFCRTFKKDMGISPAAYRRK